jgi:hypothetical protein
VATDFPNTPDGQAEFISARHKHLADVRAGKVPAAVPQPPAAGAPQAPAADPAAQEAAEAAHAAAGPGGADPNAAQPGAPDPNAQPAGDVTPQSLAEMMTAKPALKDFFEANPDVNGPIFNMARENAKLKSIAELVPSRADAEFMADHSAALVGLKTAAMRAVDDPAMVPEVLKQFDQQFAYVNDKGEPVLTPDGKPSYAPDHKVFTNAIMDREVKGYIDRYQSEFDGLKNKVNGVYPSAQAKALDEARLENLDYAITALKVLDQIRSGEFFQEEAPQLPADATPEMRDYFERQKADLKRQRDELENRTNGQKTEARQRERTEFRAQVNADKGSIAGRIIGEQIKQAIDSGVYIPEFYLQEKARDNNGNELNVSALAARIYDQFEKTLTRPGSRSLMTVAEHEMLPVGQQSREIRSAWHKERASEIIPELVKAEIQRIQGLVEKDRAKQGNLAEARRNATGPEPVSAAGSNNLPSPMSESQLRSKAEEIAKTRDGWADASPSDKQARLVTEYNRLRRTPIKR